MHPLWVPTEEGELECVSCGNHWGSELHPWCKKHAYCIICRGRGRDGEHTPEECSILAPSMPFVRLEHDCPGCGKRHQDWETCAEKAWADYQAGKIDILGEPARREEN